MGRLVHRLPDHDERITILGLPSPFFAPCSLLLAHELLALLTQNVLKN